MALHTPKLPIAVKVTVNNDTLGVMKKYIYILVALAILSGGALLALNITEKPSASKQAVETYKTYTHLFGDFTLQYPSSWKVDFLPNQEAGYAEAVSISAGNSPGLGGIYINPAKSSPKAFLEQPNRSGLDVVNSDQKELIISGKPAYFITRTTNYPEQKAHIIQKFYAVENKGFTYEILFLEYSNLTVGGLGAYDNTAFSNQFEKLVQSIQFK